MEFLSLKENMVNQEVLRYLKEQVIQKNKKTSYVC